MKSTICRKNRAVAGVSLLEVLIGLIIFTVGILGILGLQGKTMLTNDFSGNNTVARALALAQIDFLRRLQPTSPQLVSCGAPFNPLSPAFCHADSDASGAIPAGNYPQDSGSGTSQTLDPQGLVSTNGRFRRLWHVGPGVAGFPNSRTINVQVQWNDLGIEGSSKTKIRRVRYTYVMVDE